MLLLGLLARPLVAEISTEDLAQRAQTGAELFDHELAERNRQLQALLEDTSLDNAARQARIQSLQDNFLKRSREIHLKYREPFIQRVIAETNESLPESSKIQRGAGSDIYLRDESTHKVLRSADGRKVANPRHRGMQGDLDISGKPAAVERLKQSFARYDVGVTSDDLLAPGAKDFDTVNVTINVEGVTDTPGSSSHQTQVAMDALSKETYVSMGMKEKQAGRSLVETHDHAKKASLGLSQPARSLLEARGEDLLQNMSKGTLKSLSSGQVSDTQLADILKRSGYSADINTFKKQIELLKTGHLAQGVGLDADNIEAFQKACRASVDTAIDNAANTATREMDQLRSLIATTESEIQSGKLQGDALKEAQNKAQSLRHQMMDSKVRIEETRRATQAKLRGESATDLLPKSEKLISSATQSAKQPLTRMEAIKKGLKPGMLDVAGYGLSAYNVYENVTLLQEGKISRNDAIIGITEEVVDTGFGIASDVGMAAAVTLSEGTATGTLAAAASFAAPIVITAGSGYAVKEATSEGLKAYAAYQREQANTQMAEAKKQETINHFLLKGEAKINEGVAQRDWNCFLEAESIAKRLGRMYQATGDADYVHAGTELMNRLHARLQVEEDKLLAAQEKAAQEKAAQEKAAQEKAAQQKAAQEQKLAEEKQKALALEQQLKERNQRIFRFLNNLKQEINRLNQSPSWLLYKDLKRQATSLASQAHSAQSTGNLELASQYIDQHNAIVQRVEIECLNHPDILRRETLLDLAENLRAIGLQSDTEALVTAIKNSGYANEFGF